MARITYVKSARAAAKERRCLSCGHVIQVKESYKFVELKTSQYSSVTHIWCASCTPRQSQLTANARMSALYAIVEGLSDDLAHADDLDSLKSAFESAADEADSIADEYEESADNMPENLQQGSQAEEMRDKALTIHEWADELRNIDWPESGDDKSCAACGNEEDDEVHDSESEKFDHDFEEPEEPDFSEVEIPELPL